jgi:hypothetical protein
MDASLRWHDDNTKFLLQHSLTILQNALLFLILKEGIMDISNIAPNTQATAEQYSAVKLAEAPPVRKSEAVKEPVKIAEVEQGDMRRADEKRMEDIKLTIQRESFKDVFAVRDNRFTIFKDISGQYITRFTSLRDGSVTYVPEPDILRYSGGSESYYQVTA